MSASHFPACLRHSLFRRALAIALFLGATGATAQPLPEAAQASPYYFHLGLGGYRPDTNGQLGNQQGHYGLQLGGGRRITPNFAWEMDLTTYQQELDTPSTITAPVFGTKDPRSTLSTTGIAGTAMFIQPFEALEIHAGLGLGLYAVRFKTTGQQFGVPVQLTRDQNSLGWHATVGMSLKVANQLRVGVDYRQLKVQASFADVAPGTIEAGGGAWFLLLRYEP
jgi:opacity protein-like surface antigen